MEEKEETQPSFWVGLGTVMQYMFLFAFGHLRDFVRKRLLNRRRSTKVRPRSGSDKVSTFCIEKAASMPDSRLKDSSNLGTRLRQYSFDLLKIPLQGYAPIRQDYEDFYTRRLYYRLHDCFNRPICSAPDAWFNVMERTPVHAQEALKLTGKTLRCLNLGSYNYLGFAASDEYCTPKVLDSLESLGWSSCSSRADAGTTPVHLQLEQLVAEYVGKESAITFGMGFATNSMVIPTLVGKGCLVISDALNHASIVAGVRGSGAKVKVFSHNDANNLEAILRTSIAEGQPRTHRPWKKILIIVEGIYSMEGQMCRLAEIVEIKKRYKAYLFLDEAHSIGALGQSGRGCAEWAGVNPADIDIMMGTFTKSFGACGGYIAGDKTLINSLRHHSPAHLSAVSMSVPSAVQIISALEVIMGRDGTDRGARKIDQLRDNANYMRTRLTEMGCSVLGDYDSPILPLMLYQPAKIAAMSRRCLERGLAVVVVGFPAVPLIASRTRLCISAAHTREDMDLALEVLGDLADECRLHYNHNCQVAEFPDLSDTSPKGSGDIPQSGPDAVAAMTSRVVTVDA